MFAYSPQFWPPALAALLAAAFAAYAWPRRHVPAGTPYFVSTVLGSFIFAAQALLVLATPPLIKLTLIIAWGTAAIWMAVVALWRAVDYAGFASRVRPPAWFLLAVPAAALTVLISLPATQHLIWFSVSYGAGVHFEIGPAAPVLLLYVHGLLIASLIITSRVAVRTHGVLRRQAAMVTLATAVVSVSHSLQVAQTLTEQGGLANGITVLSAGAAVAGMTTWAVALFRLRAFEIAPIARYTLLESMRDGMVVVDHKNRVVDMNPAASRVLRMTRRTAIGQNLTFVLSAWPELAQVVAEGSTRAEVNYLAGSEPHTVEVDLSPLHHGAGEVIGQVLQWRDITDAKQAQALLEEQKLALAAMTEREQLGRELHDGLGQVLSYVKFQLLAISDNPEDLSRERVQPALAKVVAAVQQAQDEVRDFLSGAKRTSEPCSNLASSVSEFVEHFNARHDFMAGVTWEVEPAKVAIAPAAEVQLLRIIQESLTNVRRHSGVAAAAVCFSLVDGTLHVTITDEGSGFDAACVPADGHYGLQFMEDRAESVGGGLDVASEPGHGTRVTVAMPVRTQVQGE